MSDDMNKLAAENLREKLKESERENERLREALRVSGELGECACGHVGKMCAKCQGYCCGLHCGLGPGDMVPLL